MASCLAAIVGVSRVLRLSFAQCEGHLSAIHDLVRWQPGELVEAHSCGRG